VLAREAVQRRAVDTHVVNIRRKLGDSPGEPKWIISIRSIGYRFDG
jgi:two-component system, OmpR family, response regulator